MDRQKILRHLSRGPVVLLSLVIFSLFITVLLPRQKTKMAAYTQDVGSIDLSFFLSPDAVYDIIAAYGDSGRKAYVVSRISFDIVWPLAYTFFLISTIAFLLRRVCEDSRRFELLALTALVPLTFDFVENSFAVAVVLSYPIKMTFISWLLTGATMLKWITLGGVFLILCYGLVAWPVAWSKGVFKSRK